MTRKTVIAQKEAVRSQEDTWVWEAVHITLNQLLIQTLITTLIISVSTRVITRRLILMMTLAISRVFLEQTRSRSLRKRNKKHLRKRRKLIKLKNRLLRMLLQLKVIKLPLRRLLIRDLRKRINLRHQYPRKKR